MIDIHTHILFGIDDGAIDLEESLEMINLQKDQGVGTIVLTPHFKPKTMNFENFCEIRRENSEILKKLCPEINLVLGCELLAEDLNILKLDLKKLCVENTQYLLVEFPVCSTKYMVFKIIDNLVNMGITPIVAHVERYSNICAEPLNLYDLVDMGALLQVNCSTVLNKDALIKKSISKNLIHFVASDTHNLGHRKPNLKIALDSTKPCVKNRFIDNANKMINNKNISINDKKKIKKIGKIYI